MFTLLLFYLIVLPALILFYSRVLNHFGYMPKIDEFITKHFPKEK